MSNSVWFFGCKKGLAQGTCGQYKKDRKSRGTAQRMGGCPSCKHRTADNAETMRAEAYHADN